MSLIYLILCHWLRAQPPTISFLWEKYYLLYIIIFRNVLRLKAITDVNDNPICRTEKKKKTQIYRTVF